MKCGIVNNFIYIYCLRQTFVLCFFSLFFWGGGGGGGRPFQKSSVFSEVLLVLFLMLELNEIFGCTLQTTLGKLAVSRFSVFQIKRKPPETARFGW